jgi:hypothetical protein
MLLGWRERLLRSKFSFFSVLFIQESIGLTVVQGSSS